MNIVKELRKLLRFRVLIVRLWGGGGSYKSNSTISSNSSVQQWGGEGVCKWQKFENFFDFGCYWEGGGGEGMGTVIIHIEIYKYNRTAQRNTFKTVGASYHPHRSSM